MSYDEAKMLALDTVIPQMGEVRYDLHMNFCKLTVIGFMDRCVVFMLNDVADITQSEKCGQWCRYVRNGRYR